MRCPTCGGDNVDGAKFCGVCGARMVASTVPPVADVAPRVTAETRQVPQQPLPGASLGESIRVPEAKGARMAKIGIVLALDAALAIAGIVLMTQGGGGGDAVAEGAKAGSGTATASGSGTETGGGEVGTGTGTGTVNGGGSTGGGGTTGGGGGVTGGGAGGGGGSRGTGAGTGTGTMGSGSGSERDPIEEAAEAAANAGKIDAGTGTTPPPTIDAGVTVMPLVDAAPAAEVPVDAADTTDAGEEAASATQLANHLARLVVQSGGKMDRCYQNATKALPDDQPLSGEVDIGLAVMPTGAVQNVRVTRNTTGSNDLGNCVQATAAQWAFPAHAENEPVEFSHVFRFGPRNQ